MCPLKGDFIPLFRKKVELLLPPFGCLGQTWYYWKHSNPSLFHLYPPLQVQSF